MSRSSYKSSSQAKGGVKGRKNWTPLETAMLLSAIFDTLMSTHSSGINWSMVYSNYQSILHQQGYPSEAIRGKVEITRRFENICTQYRRKHKSFFEDSQNNGKTPNPIKSLSDYKTMVFRDILGESALLISDCARLAKSINSGSRLKRFFNAALVRAELALDNLCICADFSRKSSLSELDADEINDLSDDGNENDSVADELPVPHTVKTTKSNQAIPSSEEEVYNEDVSYTGVTFPSPQIEVAPVMIAVQASSSPIDSEVASDMSDVSPSLVQVNKSPVKSVPSLSLTRSRRSVRVVNYRHYDEANDESDGDEKDVLVTYNAKRRRTSKTNESLSPEAPSTPPSTTTSTTASPSLSSNPLPTLASKSNSDLKTPSFSPSLNVPGPVSPPPSPVSPYMDSKSISPSTSSPAMSADGLNVSRSLRGASNVTSTSTSTVNVPSYDRYFPQSTHLLTQHHISPFAAPRLFGGHQHQSLPIQQASTTSSQGLAQQVAQVSNAATQGVSPQNTQVRTSFSSLGGAGKLSSTEVNPLFNYKSTSVSSINSTTGLTQGLLNNSNMGIKNMFPPKLTPLGSNSNISPLSNLSNKYNGVGSVTSPLALNNYNNYPTYASSIGAGAYRNTNSVGNGVGVNNNLNMIFNTTNSKIPTFSSASSGNLFNANTNTSSGKNHYVSSLPHIHTHQYNSVMMFK